MELINLCFLIFVIIVPFNNCDDVNGKLIFSHVIYRHGDRTPQKPYINDPWGDLKYWPTGWGQLTNVIIICLSIIYILILFIIYY